MPFQTLWPVLKIVQHVFYSSSSDIDFPFASLGNAQRLMSSVSHPQAQGLRLHSSRQVIWNGHGQLNVAGRIKTLVHQYLMLKGVVCASRWIVRGLIWQAGEENWLVNPQTLLWVSCRDCLYRTTSCHCTEGSMHSSMRGSYLFPDTDSCFQSSYTTCPAPNFRHKLEATWLVFSS